MHPVFLHLFKFPAMAKKQTKKQLQNKWNNRERNLRSVYKEVNGSLKGWKNSDTKAEFNKREKRAFDRFKNRKKINERARQSYKAKKEFEKLPQLMNSQETTVFYAFSTKRGKAFEDNIKSLVRERGSIFYGEIIINKRLVGRYSDYGRYYIRIHQLIQSIAKTDSDLFFSSHVNRSYSFDAETNTILTSHDFTISDDENDEENE